MSLRLGIIGCGLKAADYARAWTTMPGAPDFIALSDTSPASIARYSSIVGAGPRVYDDGMALLAAEAENLDAIYVSTPHAFHAPYATAALGRGLDVLLEKPMALTLDEARSVIAARDSTSSTVVVAYQCSLSPLIRAYRDRATSMEWGRLLSVTGEVWENWNDRYGDSWKQVPDLSGGGFIFDTGNHLLNAVIETTGLGYARIAAHLDHTGRGYELTGAALGQLDGDIPLTLSFCGGTTPGCESALTLFFEDAILRVDIWGRWAELRRGDIITRQVAGEDKAAVFTTFAAARKGARNPSPPERSLHLAEIWDLMKRSAARGGTPLDLTTRPEDPA